MLGCLLSSHVLVGCMYGKNLQLDILYEISFLIVLIGHSLSCSAGFICDQVADGSESVDVMRNSMALYNSLPSTILINESKKAREKQSDNG